MKAADYKQIYACITVLLTQFYNNNNSVSNGSLNLRSN